MQRKTAGPPRPLGSQLLIIPFLFVMFTHGAFASVQGSSGKDSHSASIHMSYDDLGRVVRLTYPSRAAATYSYNYQSGHKSVSYDGMEVASATEFDPTGKVVRRLIEDAAGGPSAVEERAYDVLGRLVEQRLSIDHQTVYSAAEMTYDPRGFLSSQRRSDALISNALLTYGYTEQGQLESFGIGSAQADFHYDSRGNLRSRSSLTGYGLHLPSYSSPGSFNTANQPTSASYQYDAAGRLIRDPDFVYAYNDIGRLALVEDHHGQLVAHYLYDVNGHRVRKLTEETVTYFYRNSGVLVSEEIYDHEGLLIEQKDHISQNGGGHLMTASYGETATYESQLTDRLGNPAVRWSNDDFSFQEYSPFGIRLNPAPQAERDGSFGFTGHEEDAETGDVYMRARYFDPAMARFAAPDPARDVDPYSPASYNLYQYVGNNPVSYVDPSGMAGSKASKAFWGGVKVLSGIGVIVLFSASLPAVAAAGTTLAILGTISAGAGIAEGAFLIFDGAGSLSEAAGAENPLPEEGLVLNAVGNASEGFGVDREAGQAIYLATFLVRGLAATSATHSNLPPWFHRTEGYLTTVKAGGYANMLHQNASGASEETAVTPMVYMTILDLEPLDEDGTDDQRAEDADRDKAEASQEGPEPDDEQPE